MNRSPLRPPTTGASPALLLGDLAMMALCLIAVFWLLVSPLIPILFSEGELIIWTLLLGIPLGLLGVYLNHRAAASPRPQRGRTRR
ncbi:MAG TPA: hypothetical protein VIU62_04365 [Chloroflexota bacterium]